MLFAKVLGVTASQTTSGAPCPCVLGTSRRHAAATAPTMSIEYGFMFQKSFNLIPGQMTLANTNTRAGTPLAIDSVGENQTVRNPSPIGWERVAAPLNKDLTSAREDLTHYETQIPELYQHLNPMPYKAAVRMEIDLVEDWRRARYTSQAATDCLPGKAGKRDT